MTLLKKWNGKSIRFRDKDQFGCLTDMAKATDKKVNDWLRLQSTSEYLSSLSSITGIPVDQLLDSKVGGNLPDEERGTWAAKRVCIRFAQWCSPEFAVQVDTWIQELFTNKTVSLQSFEIPTSFPDNLLDAAKMMSKYMNYWVNAEEEKVVLTKQLKSAEQVLDIYRTVLDENACLTFKQFADALAYKGLGRNNLIKFCREVGFLVKRGEAVPRRQFVDNGCAIVVTSSYEIQGVQHTTQSTKLTFKGLAWVLNRLRNNGHLITKTARKIWDTYNPITDETYLVEAKREQLLATAE